MSPDELRRLLDAQPLGLLDDAQRAALDAALADDEDLQTQSDALAAAYAAWTDRVEADDTPWSTDLPDRVVRAALRARDETARDPSAGEETDMDATKKKPALAPAPTVVAAVAEKIRLTCTYCHALAGREQLAYCATCLAPHHEDCFTEHGHCATPGCDETRVVRPHDVQPRRRGPRPLFFLGMAISLATGVAALTATRIASDSSASAPPVPTALELPSEAPPPATRLALELRDTPLAEAVADLDARIPEVTLELDPDAERDPVTLVLPAVAWQDAVDELARVSETRVEVRGDGRVVLTAPPRVTLQFTDASLKACLELVASYAGKTVEVDDDVSGEVTADLKDVPWDAALLALCAPHRLRVWQAEAGVRVGAPDSTPRPGEELLALPAGLPKDGEPLRYPPITHRVDLPGGRQQLDEVVAGLGLAVAIDPDVATRPLDWSERDARPREIELTAATALPWPEALRRVAEAAGCMVIRRGREQRLTLSQLPRVTIQFTMANIRTVFQLLAAYTGKNVVIAPDVNGAVTSDLGEVEWDLGLTSLATTLRARAWQVGDHVAVLQPQDAPAPQGARPFELIPVWTGRPADHVRVDVGRGTVAELCAQVADQSSARVECRVDGDEVLDLGLSQVSWRQAVREVARAAGCWVDDVNGGVRLRPRQHTRLRAFDAPLGTWLQLLGAHADRRLLLSPAVELRRLTIDLTDVSPLDAFEGSVRALGLVSEPERTYLLRVMPGERLPANTFQDPPPPGRGRLGDVELDWPVLQAVVQIEDAQPAAILEHRIYREGDELIDPETEEPLPVIVSALRHDRVRLSTPAGDAHVWLVAEQRADGSWQTRVDREEGR